MSLSRALSQMSLVDGIQYLGFCISLNPQKVTF